MNISERMDGPFAVEAHNRRRITAARAGKMLGVVAAAIAVAVTFRRKKSSRGPTSGGQIGRRALPWQRHSRGDRKPLFRAYVIKPFLMFLIGKVGVSPGGNQILVTVDPATGEPHMSGITPWTRDDGRYLISARGEQSQWVGFVRAQGRAQLKVGRRTEDIAVSELGLDEKLPILRWYATVRLEVESDEELVARAPDTPVFRITPSQ